MAKDLLLEAYVGMLSETGSLEQVTQLRSGSSQPSSTSTSSLPTARAPTNPAINSPQEKNTSLDTIIDATDLGDFLHYIREYFYTLPSEQQENMCNFLRDNISPQE